MTELRPTNPFQQEADRLLRKLKTRTTQKSSDDLEKLSKDFSVLEAVWELLASPEARQPDNVDWLIQRCPKTGQFNVLTVLSRKQLPAESAKRLQQLGASCLFEQIEKLTPETRSKRRIQDSARLLAHTEDICEGLPDKLLDWLFDYLHQHDVLLCDKARRGTETAADLVWHELISQLAHNIDGRLAGLLEDWDTETHQIDDLAYCPGVGPQTLTRLLAIGQNQNLPDRRHQNLTRGLARQPDLWNQPEGVRWMLDQQDPLTLERLLFNAPNREYFQQALERLIERLGPEGRETLLQISGQQKKLITREMLEPLLSNPKDWVRRQTLRQLGQTEPASPEPHAETEPPQTRRHPGG